MMNEFCFMIRWRGGGTKRVETCAELCRNMVRRWRDVRIIETREFGGGFSEASTTEITPARLIAIGFDWTDGQDAAPPCASIEVTALIELRLEPYEMDVNGRVDWMVSLTVGRPESTKRGDHVRGDHVRDISSVEDLVVILESMGVKHGAS